MAVLGASAEARRDVEEEGGERFSLLGRRLPPALALRLVVLEPGTRLEHDPDAWRGGLVVLEHGAIVLETLRGERLPLACGAVLWLDRLPLRAVVNPGDEQALLAVLTRRPR
jgi:hypothetical protein